MTGAGNSRPMDAQASRRSAIVDLEEEAIEVYREPHLAGYASTTLVRPGEKACSLAFPDAAVDMAELLKRS